MQRTTRLKKPQVPEPGALIEFDDILGRPKYAGEEMTSETDIPSVTAEAEARQAADQEIWTEIETIEAASDVVDVVGTYADLEAYDTSKLHDKDLIKVLQDETRDDAITYYRFSKTAGTFSYVGAEGPYYTASETDTLLSGKQDTLIAGSNVQIAADGKTISATDTTYSDFVGATALTNGENGLVPAPLSTDVSKFLQGDGSWGTPTDTTYTAGTNVQISNQNVISATDTTYSAFTGASSSVAGAAGLVPAPAVGDQDKVLKGDGTWGTAQAGNNTVFVYSTEHYSPASADLFKDAAKTIPMTAAELYAEYAAGNTVIIRGTVVSSTTEAIVDNNVIKAYRYINSNTNDTTYRFVILSSGRAAYSGINGICYLGATSTGDTNYPITTFSMQQKLTAGSGITIASDGTISATGGGSAGEVLRSEIATNSLFDANLMQYASITSTFYDAAGNYVGVPDVLDKATSGLITFLGSNSPALPSVTAEAVATVVDVTHDSAQRKTYIDVLVSAVFDSGQVVNMSAPVIRRLSISDTNPYYITYEEDFSLGGGTTYTAGTNIQISASNVISATDTTYSAGTGIAISAQNVISASSNNISSNDWSALWQ